MKIRRGVCFKDFHSPGSCQRKFCRFTHEIPISLRNDAWMISQVKKDEDRAAGKRMNKRVSQSQVHDIFSTPASRNNSRNNSVASQSNSSSTPNANHVSTQPPINLQQQFLINEQDHQEVFPQEHVARENTNENTNESPSTTHQDCHQTQPPPTYITSLQEQYFLNLIRTMIQQQQQQHFLPVNPQTAMYYQMAPYPPYPTTTY